MPVTWGLLRSPLPPPSHPNATQAPTAGGPLPGPGRCNPQCWRLWHRSLSQSFGCSTAGTCAAPRGPPRTTRLAHAASPPPQPLPRGTQWSTGALSLARGTPMLPTSMGPQLHWLRAPFLLDPPADADRTYLLGRRVFGQAPALLPILSQLPASSSGGLAHLVFHSCSSPAF